MPPRQRRLAAYAGTSEGQPQLDVDELQKSLDAHQEQYRIQADANAEAAANSAASGSGIPAEGLPTLDDSTPSASPGSKAKPAKATSNA